MLLDRVDKETADVTRIVVDMSWWLDQNETIAQIVSYEVIQGMSGWSEAPYPPRDSPPPYDPTPLLLTSAALDEFGRQVLIFVEFGTPGLAYTLQFVVDGTAPRRVAFEIGVQITGVPPAEPLPLPPPPSQAAGQGPVDAYLNIAGGTMQGPLYLVGGPTYPTEAVSKHYVDSMSWAAGPFMPEAGGTFTGAVTMAAPLFLMPIDPVDPLEATNKQYVDAQIATVVAPTDAFLPIVGGTLTGPLTLAADPTAALQAATKQYVDAHAGSGGAFLPLTGGTLTGPLTLAADPTAALQAATKQYVDAHAVAPTFNDVGRSLLHNSMFNVAQRGAGPFTASGNYTADRWQLLTGTSTASVTLAPITDASRTQIGDEAASSALTNAFTGGAAAGSYVLIWQPIEDVRRLAGKTVTVSFYAAALAGTPKFGVSFDQYFGSGGSPSTIVNGNGASVTLGTAWARYSVPLTLPSIAGKTLGTNGDSRTTLILWYSAEATAFAARSGGIGVQSGTVFVWGVQLEIGSVATPLEKPDVFLQLQQCQRFFQSFTFDSAQYAPAAAAIIISQLLPVVMRAPPTLTGSQITYSNTSGLSLVAWSGGMVDITYTVTTTAIGRTYGTINASADL